MDRKPRSKEETNKALAQAYRKIRPNRCQNADKRPQFESVLKEHEKYLEKYNGDMDSFLYRMRYKIAVDLICDGTMSITDISVISGVPLSKAMALADIIYR